MIRSCMTLAPLPAVAAAWALLSTGCLSQTEGGEATAGQSTPLSKAPRGVGMQVSIERRASTVEVRIEAAGPFALGAMPPVLVIGDKAFGRSKHPADGRPNVLIFMIDAAEFAALPAGAEVSVGSLRSSARLARGEEASGSSAPAGPRIHPHQVEARRRLGVLAQGGMEVLQ
jgi:hypothetical protein